MGAHETLGPDWSPWPWICLDALRRAHHVVGKLRRMQGKEKNTRQQNMPRSKRKPKALPQQTKSNEPQNFPFAQYISVLGTYVVLVCFAALALPPSAKWLGFQPIPQATSLDRPQHPLLNPITANPAGTVIMVSMGVFVITIWWAGWMRLWWAQEKHLTRIENNTLRAQEKIFVCRPRYINFISADDGHLQKMRSASILTLLGGCVYYVVLILFGAPLLR